MTATLDRPLTEQEHDIVSLLLDGYTINQIATRLSVKPNTVTRRLNDLKTVLDTHTNVHTAVECLRRGLIGRPDTHRAQRVRAELAARHTSTCALLQPRQCTCRYAQEHTR